MENSSLTDIVDRINKNTGKFKEIINAQNETIKKLNQEVNTNKSRAEIAENALVESRKTLETEYSTAINDAYKKGYQAAMGTIYNESNPAGGNTIQQGAKETTKALTLNN